MRPVEEEDGLREVFRTPIGSFDEESIQDRKSDLSESGIYPIINYIE